MFRTMSMLTVLGLFGLTAGVKAQTKMTAKEVLTKAIEASGGLEALKKFPAGKEKSKGTMDFGGVDIAFTADASFMEPDKMRTAIAMEFMGQKIKIVQLVNGEKIRMTANGQEPPLDDNAKAELKDSLVLHQVGTIFPLLDEKLFDVKMQDDKVKVGEAESYAFTIKGKTSKEMKLFIDAKTFLPSKLEKMGTNPATQKEGKQEIMPSAYKKVEGIMVPMKTSVLMDGKKFMETETLEIKLFEKLPASEFDISD